MNKFSCKICYEGNINLECKYKDYCGIYGLKNIATTAIESKPEEITSENIKEIFDKLAIHKSKGPPKPKTGWRWLEKLMNKFGWYRRYTIFILDSDTFKRPYYMQSYQPMTDLPIIDYSKIRDPYLRYLVTNPASKINIEL